MVKRLFSYKAKNLSGNILTGKIRADNEKAVAEYIQTQKYFVTEIRPVYVDWINHKFISIIKRIDEQEIINLFRQLSLMMHAGISLNNALEIIIKQTQNDSLRYRIQDISQTIQDGQSLSAAFTQNKKIFSTYMISLVKVGEFSGTLDKILVYLANDLEKKRKIFEKIRIALVYPVLVLVVAFVVVIFIFIFVIPVLANMFVNMNIEMPLPTRCLLIIGDFFQNYILYIIGLFISGVLGFIYMVRHKNFRYWLDKVILNIPIVGTLIKKYQIVQLSRTLSTLIHSGISIHQALEISVEVMVNRVFAKAIEGIRQEICDGATLAVSVEKQKLFPMMIIQLIHIGEVTGKLEDILMDIVKFYEADIDKNIRLFNQLLEPCLIIFLAIIVGSIVISVLLPIFSMIDHIVI